jgi:hypothetical protein
MGYGHSSRRDVDPVFSVRFALNAARAGTNKDGAALIALLASGRIYQVSAGTEIDAEDAGAERGVAITVVRSGPLIGKTLYMGAKSLQ